MESIICCALQTATDPYPPDAVTMDDRPVSSIADVHGGAAKSKFNKAVNSTELPVDTQSAHFACSEFVRTRPAQKLALLRNAVHSLIIYSEVKCF